MLIVSGAFVVFAIDNPGLVRMKLEATLPKALFECNPHPPGLRFRGAVYQTIIGIPAPVLWHAR